VHAATRRVIRAAIRIGFPNFSSTLGALIGVHQARWDVENAMHHEMGITQCTVAASHITTAVADRTDRQLPSKNARIPHTTSRAAPRRAVVPATQRDDRLLEPTRFAHLLRRSRPVRPRARMFVALPLFAQEIRIGRRDRQPRPLSVDEAPDQDVASGYEWSRTGHARAWQEETCCRERL